MIYRNKVIRQLRDKGKFTEEFLSFYEEIFKEQSAHLKKINKKSFFKQLKEKEIKKRLSSGKPAIDFESFLWDVDFLNAMFNSLATLLESSKLRDEKEIDRFRKARESGKVNLEELMKIISTGDTASIEKLKKNIRVSKDLIILFSVILSGPLLDLYADKIVPHISEKEWNQGFCPVCGNAPAIARFEREAGKRILWCSLCNTDWVFQRLTCPFCSNTDHNSLKFFSIDADSPYRVDVCTKCKGYIKTVDERKIDEAEEVIMLAEDFLTYYLDDIAVKEGFKK